MNLLRDLTNYGRLRSVLTAKELQTRPLDYWLTLDRRGEWVEPYLRPADAVEGAKRGSVLGFRQPLTVSRSGGGAFPAIDSLCRVLGVDKAGSGCGRSQQPGNSGAKSTDCFWSLLEGWQANQPDPVLAAVLKFGRDQVLGDGEPVPDDHPARVCGEPVKWGAINVAFEVEGQPLVANDRWTPGWRTYFNSLSRPPQGQVRSVVSGEPVEVCLSHPVKIQGLPETQSGVSYLISVDKGTPAAQSYGFSQGEHAPMSANEAMEYAMALNLVIAEGDVYNDRVRGSTCPLAWLWWGDVPGWATQLREVWEQATAEQLAWLETVQPPAGQLHLLALRANAGRLAPMAYHVQTLDAAVANLRRWYQAAQPWVFFPDREEGPAQSPYRAWAWLRVLGNTRPNTLLGIGEQLSYYRTAWTGQPLRSIEPRWPDHDELALSLVHFQDRLTPVAV